MHETDENDWITLCSILINSLAETSRNPLGELHDDRLPAFGLECDTTVGLQDPNDICRPQNHGNPTYPSPVFRATHPTVVHYAEFGGCSEIHPCRT
jgi:hypothetical protein